MIEKLRTLDDIPTNTQLEKNILTLCSTYTNKINELVDAVNTIQKEREAEWFEIREWIDILEAVRKSVNIHEKQIDELQMKVEPEKCENPSENVLTKSLRMDKEFAEDECARLQDELERTKKQLVTKCNQLDVAVDALDRMAIDDNVSGMIARNAIKEIKALEQKE